MRRRQHSLRGRIVATIIGSVLTTSLVFGLAAFVIAYTMEDRLFQRALTEEIVHQKAFWQRNGALAVPKNTDVSIHPNGEGLPQEITLELAENPGQSEFFGRAGRHYHIQNFELGGKRPGTDPVSAIAVIEVSKDLLVRPYRDSIIELLIWMSLVIAAAMAGLGWWLVSRATKPLGALARDVATAPSTIPTICAADYPANEIGLLAESLEQAFTRIRGFVDRERAFTRDASHELRTPLAVVRGAAEVIALNRSFPSELAEPLRRIKTATSDMALALDQLLALARESNGVVREVVALLPMIEKAVSWAKARYPDSAIVVSTKIDHDVVACVHPTSLQLILNNLIGNCFQHVQNGQLTIEFENDCLSLSDDGPGIGIDGDPFAPHIKGKSSSGSGLGLDITRRLCEAAGIGLSASRAQTGQGAHFRLTFGDGEA